MDLHNEMAFEDDLNLDFPTYARHFVANEERYTEEGFYFYQIQTGLEESPRASEVVEDLETLVEAGILEKDEVDISSKFPDQYVLAHDEETTIMQNYAEKTREWTEEYIESLRYAIPRI